MNLDNRMYFGEASRFCVFEDGELWLVRDAEVCDEKGHSTVVFQAPTKTEALKHFGYTENERMGIIPL